MDRFVTPEPLHLPPPEDLEDLLRADLVFTDVDHSGPSYETRVFFNNPEAGFKTPAEAEEGYVGSFYVFGHGACFGEEGHCDPLQEYRDDFDIRPAHPILPINRMLIVTDEVQALGETELIVTLIPAEHRGEDAEPSDALAFSEVRLLLFET